MQLQKKKIIKKKKTIQIKPQDHFIVMNVLPFEYSGIKKIPKNIKKKLFQTKNRRKL